MFRDNITDHIALKNRTDFVTPPGLLLVTSTRIANGVNQGAAATEGFETQINFHLTSNSNLLFNYAHINIWQTQTGLTTDFPNSMPKDTISALFNQRFDENWDASFAYYQAGKVEALGDGDPEGLMRRADLRLARKFNMGTKSGEVSLVIENLFDSHYHEFADYNTAKRLARVNFSLDF